MSAHTAGPWYHVAEHKSADSRSGRRFHGIGTGAVHVGYASITGCVREAEALANARLIAAAPEMLKALEVTLKWWTSTTAFQDGEDEMPSEVFDGLRSAIARAMKGTP